MKKDLQDKLADNILDKGAKFHIKVFGVKIPFSIKPLYLGTLIKISKLQLKVSEIKETTNAIIVANFRTSLNPMSKSIAYAVLNNAILIFLLGRILTYFFKWKLNTSELKDLFAIIINQMGIEAFFLATISIKGINLLSKEDQNTLQQTPSMEQSEKSVKPSDGQNEKSFGEQAGHQS